MDLRMMAARLAGTGDDLEPELKKAWQKALSEASTDEEEEYVYAFAKHSEPEDRTLDGFHDYMDAFESYGD